MLGDVPAFPACNEANNNGTMGMTLRDYFAGQALAGLLAAGTTYGGAAYAGQNHEKLAKDAYAFSDAMIATRKGGEA